MITCYCSAQSLSSIEQVVNILRFFLSLTIHKVPKASKGSIYHRIPDFLIMFVPIASKCFST